jgi:hypothetical protein
MLAETPDKVPNNASAANAPASSLKSGFRMNLDYYVITPGSQDIPYFLLRLALMQCGYSVCVVKEWPVPALVDICGNASAGDTILGWPINAGAESQEFDRLYSAGDARRLIHLNYDMRIEGASLEGFRKWPEGSGFFINVRPHGGSCPFFHEVAAVLASLTRGYVWDPLQIACAPERNAAKWFKLNKIEIPNPNRS